MADPIKRLNYFNGQFLREPDFQDEQGYHLRHQRDHARLLHTPGIAEGLEIPDPPAGATAVTINAGAAFDDQGRRIVLANNQTLELADQAPDQAVYVTVAYGETQTDPTDETGITGNTRWTEAPLIETAVAAPANPSEKLVLARVSRTGTAVAAIDRSGRRTAGVKGGDLEVRSLAFTSESIAPTGWVQAELGASGRADLGGSLRVTGNLIVDGTIQGNIAVNTVETGDLVDNAVTSAKLAEADGTSGQNANTGTGVKTGHIQDGAVTLAKLAANSVDAARIVDGSVGTNELANAAVTNAKLADNSVSTAKIIDASVGTAEIADGAVTNAKLADNSVNAAKIADGTVGTAELADLAVTTAKLAVSSVDASKMVDGSVGTNKLANGAVTNVKLADNSVNAAKIVDGSVGTGELADGAVTNSKLATNAVTAAKIAAGAVGNDALAAASVSPDKVDSAVKEQLLGGYVSFSGSSLTIHKQFNVTSVTRLGVGDYQITWINPLFGLGPWFLSTYTGNIIRLWSTGGNQIRVRTFSLTAPATPVDEFIVSVMMPYVPG